MLILVFFKFDNDIKKKKKYVVLDVLPVKLLLLIVQNVQQTEKISQNVIYVLKINLMIELHHNVKVNIE